MSVGIPKQKVLRPILKVSKISDMIYDEATNLPDAPNIADACERRLRRLYQTAPFPVGRIELVDSCLPEAFMRLYRREPGSIEEENLQRALRVAGARDSARDNKIAFDFVPKKFTRQQSGDFHVQYKDIDVKIIFPRGYMNSNYIVPPNNPHNKKLEVWITEARKIDRTVTSVVSGIREMQNRLDRMMLAAQWPELLQLAGIKFTAPERYARGEVKRAEEKFREAQQLYLKATRTQVEELLTAASMLEDKPLKAWVRDEELS